MRFGRRRRSRKVRKSNARERGRGEPSQVPVDLERTNPRDKMVFFFSLFLAQCMVHFSYVGGEGKGYPYETREPVLDKTWKWGGSTSLLCIIMDQDFQVHSVITLKYS